MNGSAAEVRRVRPEPDGPTDAAVTHPERTDDPRTLRWVTTGRILTADPMPTTLQALVDDRIADSVVIRPGRVLITLAEGLEWPEYGRRVRDAVLAALREPSPAGHNITAEEVAAVATEIIDELIAPVATAHAGDVDLISATRDTVRVRLSGACRHCPLAALTVQGRLAGELNRRLPDQGIQVIGVNDGSRIARVRDRLRNRPPAPRPRP